MLLKWNTDASRMSENHKKVRQLGDLIANVNVLTKMEAVVVYLSRFKMFSVFFSFQITTIRNESNVE
jgi:hypothetical protein